MNPHGLAQIPLPQLLVIFVIGMLIYGTMQLRKK
jgi:hypothetical protein